MPKRILLICILLLSICSFVCACNVPAEEAEPIPQEIYYTVTYEVVDGGTVEGKLVQILKDGERSEEVTAVAADGYAFCGWNDGVLTANRSDEVVGNITISPIFKKIYTVTFMGVCDGITLYEEKTDKIDGEEATVQVKDVLGYAFNGFSDGKSENSRTFTVSCDTEICAVYEIETLELPIFNIITENMQAVTSKETYLKSSITLFNTDEKYCFTDVSAKIRGRGNYTWGAEKKPYRIKFDKKTELFGCGYKQKSWVLLANYYDKSLSRNYIAYELSKQFDGIAFSSVHIPVEVYLNGEYLGVYLLCDQMQTGTGRVDISEDYETNGADTGYLLELDGRAASEGVENIDYFTLDNSVAVGVNTYAIKTPDTDEDAYKANSETYVTFIKDYLRNCMSVLKNGDWETVNAYIDVESFVDTYIIQELFANNDVGWSSVYLYKEKGGKLYAGPVWDFDIGGGNICFDIGNVNDCLPETTLVAIKNNPWYNALSNYDEFKQQVSEKLKVTYKQKIFDTLELLDCNNENGLYKQGKDALSRNFKKWERLGKYDYPNPHSVVIIDTVDGQIEYLRRWLLLRYYYLTECYNI